jgi:hypothetical protein
VARGRSVRSQEQYAEKAEEDKSNSQHQTYSRQSPIRSYALPRVRIAENLLRTCRASLSACGICVAKCCGGRLRRQTFTPSRAACRQEIRSTATARR